jgi:hypothetical protein
VRTARQSTTTTPARGHGDGKLSPPFKARLSRLGDKAKVRAIVLLRTDAVPPGAAREEAVRAVRQSAHRRLVDIDAILERYGGRRLAEAPDALGSVPVEATAQGILALAASEQVRAVLEDQAVSFPALRPSL